MIDRISVQKNCSQRSPTMFSMYPDDLHVYDANASRCVGNQNELLDTAKGLFLSILSLSDEFLSADDFLFYSVPKNHSEWPLGPVKTSKRSDLDHYAGIETVLVRGYVLWLIAICLLAATLIAGLVAPDVELARSVAAAEYLNMECVPLHSPSHVSVNN
ncbi:hypothetical protein FGB62_123g017 [Gracilaria domingensis]|nr:hypothetical protein FGB62_123g017 [Gracilaria domingensis]